MIIGLDIGGTKIEGIALDPNTLEEIAKIRKPTQKDAYNHFLESVRNVLTFLAEKGTIDSIGISCCGSIGNDGLMQGANVTVLNGKDFVGDLQKYFDVPIKLANDADCLALSEFVDGAGKEAANSCVGIIIGTGCGSGVITYKSLVTGLNKLGGELGHNPLPHFDKDIDGSKAQCYCGSYNCSELFVSGTGFARTYHEKYGEDLTTYDIVQNAKNNDAKATEHLDLYCDQLARVCGTIVNFVDPEVIVLGGGMSNIDEIYPLVNAKLDNYTFTKNTLTKVVKNVHGDSSGIRGAAFLHR
ncbi:ROK family protein [Vibrio sp.]|nr:ROK family protein [Vibrio sp.]